MAATNDTDTWVIGPPNNLASALAKAQAAIQSAKRESVNPHYRSKYADLAAVWDACRKPLTDNRLSVVQFTTYRDGLTLLVTRLQHASGEHIDGEYPLLPTKPDPQGMGSAMTYARRYGLAAMVGVAPDDDDDGNAASAPAKNEPVSREPHGFADWLQSMADVADTGTEELRKAWAESDKDMRAAVTDVQIKALRARAEAADKAAK